MEYKVIIAPWGQPKLWKETSYRYKDCELEKIKSSLFTLYHCLNPDKVIIIGSDSLSESGNTYEHIVCSSKNIILGTIMNTPGSETSGMMEKTKIIISYNVGKFKLNNLQIEGDLGDFYPHVLWNLFNYLWEDIRHLPGDSNIEIYIDLTHGQNFMPTLTHKAVDTIASILSMIYKNIKITLLNSEPFVIGEERTYDIYELSSYIAKPNFYVPPIPVKNDSPDEFDKSFLEPINNSNLPNSPNVFNQINNTGKMEYNAFSASMQRGLLMGIYKFFPNLSKLKRAIEDIFNFYEQSIVVKFNQEKCIRQVRKHYRFSDNFDKLIQIHILGLMAQKAGVSCRRNMVDLSSLYDLNYKLYYNDAVLYYLVKNELDKLNNPDKSPKCKQTRSDDKHKLIRNIMAHALFINGIIEYKDGCARWCVDNQVRYESGRKSISIAELLTETLNIT